MSSKNNLTPKLRFPEFRNRGEWSIQELGSKTVKVGSGIAPIQSFLVPLPPNSEEQQRITDCLADFDARIATLTEMLAVLRAYNTGLMQQLFPSATE